MKRIVQGLSKKCLFDCIYCFVDETYETNGQTEISVEQIKEIELIQPFCDYDVFACEKCNWKKEITEYAKYGKIISFATKAYVSKDKAEELSRINQMLISKGAFLHVGITITTVEDVEIIEKNTPSVLKRIETIKNLANVGINCSVIIRPLLPTISKDDISYIVDNTRDYCSNYVYGPLYLNEEMKRYLEEKRVIVDTLEHKALWRKDEPVCRIYHSTEWEEKKDYLIKYCVENEVSIFASNDAAVEDIRRKKMEKYYNELKEKSMDSYGNGVVKASAMLITESGKKYMGVNIKTEMSSASMTAISNVICNAVSSGEGAINNIYIYVETGNIRDVIDDETMLLLKEFNPSDLIIINENDFESVRSIYEK